MLRRVYGVVLGQPVEDRLPFEPGERVEEHQGWTVARHLDAEVDAAVAHVDDLVAHVGDSGRHHASPPVVAAAIVVLVSAV